MMKYANYIILVLLLGVGVLFKDYIHVSTNLLSLFASKDAIEKLAIADELGYSKEMLIIVKGLDKSSKSKVRKISKELVGLDNILLVQSTLRVSPEVQQYYKEYYPLLANFNDSKQSLENIRAIVQELYDGQSKNIFYSAIDRNDPLKLFNLDNLNSASVSHKGEFITLGDYGYLIRVTTDVSASQMNKAKELYQSVNFILSSYTDVISFAPFYYTVENSTKIQKDVQWILVLSTIILLIIYYLLLKNIRLLSHTLIALFSSMVFAALTSTLVFSNFNVLSLAFGMSITAVSIDYLLHYYFHNFYKTKRIIDKNVLYGYLTTTVAFGIFTLIPIPIISQISFFAVMSLLFAYFLFTFVFPYLELKEYEDKAQTKVSKVIIPAYIFFILSLIFFVYSGLNIKLDNNIRNLDYQNIKLREIESLVKKHNTSKLKPIIVQANSKYELIDNLHLIHKKLPGSFSLASFVENESECQKKQNILKHYDFGRLNKVVNKEASLIGFRDNYFRDAYSFTQTIPTCQVENFDIFKSYNLSVYQKQESYYTIALVSDVEVIKELEFVTNIDVKEMFSQQSKEIYKDLFLYSMLVVLVIFVLLLFSVRKRFIYALNYILFPISLTLAILVTFININLMHLFALIILIAIGIDYGIYMSNTKKLSSTMLAIKYSILSTFGAFGVLVFSSISALNSIGIVISIGAVTIFTLIKVMK